MSVRSGLLILLAEGPNCGAHLRGEFEMRTGGTCPLNVGQVYTTLSRLERDGLVGVANEPDNEGRIHYHLTEAGQAEAAQWWLTPVTRESAPRDELAIKLALAVTTPGVDVARVIQAQRTATMQHLRDLTRLKARALRHRDDRSELAWELVLENLIFGAEAEVRWLDHVEAQVRRKAQDAPLPSAVAPHLQQVGASDQSDLEVVPR